MSVFVFIAADLAAIAALIFGLYYPRHRRRDMIAPFLAINVGVLGVTYAMATTDLSLGFGLGIFAVLSIIRLRSAEMDHAEIAYYFTAIALGLLGGFPSISAYVSFTLMAVLVAVIAAGDSPRLFARGRQHQLVLDRAVFDEAEARNLAGAMLGTTVDRLIVRKIDTVNDTTIVDVRYSARSASAEAHRHEALADAGAGLGVGVATDAEVAQERTLPAAESGTLPTAEVAR